ncbi:LysE family translocator [Pseudogulbenkiania subflava]|uniref:Threonine/homoserine/homoserine lactone efflux protein n=1 Tax=Pseudogulbenkiania subflava DSM 22618 TaxID=1123014 RepID=A0A1Y6C6P2_9NEIS|nr:LysE family transporter [Pseudogulbenkiania subflava]SMF36993.1 Threonine/homoserine/homoserine lactone efflux protein [Pseudogulbenkiania subflava DSM 22618]
MESSWGLGAKAVLMGLAIAAPVGPIGLLCIQRTLQHGRLAGFVSGLGAACADGLYGALGAFGLAVLSAYLDGLQQWLSLPGAVFLGWLGWRTLQSGAAATSAAALPGGRLPRLFLSTFALTLANPMTIVAFSGVFAALAASRSALSAADAWSMIAGVFTGSALWWGLLALVTGRLGQRLGTPQRRLISLLAGVLLLGMAAWQLLRWLDGLI